MRAWRNADGRRRAVLIALVLLIAAWLPGVLASDLRGLRSALRLSARARADYRGPRAGEGTNLALVDVARARIPSGAGYAIVMAGRWQPRHLPARLAQAREAGTSWTQFALAPRLEVARSRARWVLVMDATPKRAGIARPEHAWRFGRDWLVEVR
jgi:hypothetical protein